jgi:hypothetical protein
MSYAASFYTIFISIKDVATPSWATSQSDSGSALLSIARSCSIALWRSLYPRLSLSIGRAQFRRGSRSGLPPGASPAPSIRRSQQAEITVSRADGAVRRVVLAGFAFRLSPALYRRATGPGRLGVRARLVEPSRACASGGGRLGLPGPGSDASSMVAS